MDRIFVLVDTSVYAEDIVIGVFSSLENATTFAKEQKFVIEELEVREYSLNPPSRKDGYGCHKVQ